MPWEKSVTVNFNSDSTGCFYTGDIVTGSLTIDLEKDLKVETIDLEVVGISKAQWSRSMPTIPYIKIYSEKKKVLFVKNTGVFDNYRRNNIIPAGVYSYPFHFSLPNDLPSTFKSSIANVYYCVKIKSKPKHVIKKVVPFNVLGNVDINNLDEMLKPWVYEFNPGKLEVQVKTFKGIALKQTIPFEMTINNAKKIRISEVNITLVQKLRYTVTSGYAMDEKKICKISKKVVGKALSETFELNMEIPQITPSSLYTTEPMVDISYVFRVGVCFFFSFNFYEDIPVTVATVPVLHHDFYAEC